ncbi:MAG: VWA domain-containing protein [bacterium]
MFIEFFYHLRDRGLPLGVTEFITLLDALSEGLARGSLTHFYGVARSILVKRPEHYDIYDQAFAEYFEDVEFDPETKAEITEELISWLEENPLPPPELSDEELADLKEKDLEELREEFEERLEKQDERHDGGDHWVGTGGTSEFGHSGANPNGIRVGGSGQNRSAVQVANDRRFRNLRKDMTLDVRDIGQALRRLRELTRDGREEELDVQASIDETARNAGDVRLVFRPPRENNVKLLLLMDVGGSMDPYAELTSRLFSAAHQASHFKHFESYYFHNCIYETLYDDMRRREGKPTEEIFSNLDNTWRCIVVGDAAMAPGELMREGGAINYSHHNETTGYEYLNKLKDAVLKTVWLNPHGKRMWERIWTTAKIRELFPMYEFTMEGLEEAVDELRSVRTPG